MTKNDRWLDGIGIASPCSANWNEMQGDDRCRFCSQCKLHVFDLSAMTRRDAEQLVRQRTGKGERLCVRFARRRDGTVLTQDCPVGLRARIRRAAARVVAACSALLAFAGCRREAVATPAAGSTTLPPVEAPLQGEVAAPIMGDLVAPDHPEMGRIQVPEAVKK